MFSIGNESDDCTIRTHNNNELMVVRQHQQHVQLKLKEIHQKEKKKTINVIENRGGIVGVVVLKTTM